MGDWCLHYVPGQHGAGESVAAYCRQGFTDVLRVGGDDSLTVVDLDSGLIEQVICGGENYDGARPCDFEWVKALREQCVAHDVTFCFIETGTVFIKDGKKYRIPGKQVQSRQAYLSGMNYEGKPIEWRLTDALGLEIPPEAMYVPHYRENCAQCASRLICNGCSDCGKCEQ